MHGPGPKNRMRAGGQKPKDMKGVVRRIMTYLAPHKARLVVIAVCIIVTALVSIASTAMLKPIFNNYITPFIGQQNPDLSGFARFLVIMCVVYACGAAAAWLYNKLMVYVAADTLNRIRTDLFTHMEQLPLRYFDTHTHGELMSRYTNDIDAMREMLSRGLPQLFSSTLTVVGVFCAMIVMSPVLTLLIIGMLVVMLFFIKTIGGKSGRYFVARQKQLGSVNGYIEEMIEGQKVVKVFCHEDEATESFDRLNDALREADTRANTYANILMPIMGNLSHVNYALTAAVGAALTISGHLDIGTIASFLQFSRTFSQPITQASQQINSILMALAGAERIFNMMDEKVEVDDGYVTLVHATEDADGTLHETDHFTGIWAWKHPHTATGDVTYTRLRGDVRFFDVTFGYEENKTVLHDLSLYAKPGQKIAFVGSTGAGKTTITNLINRFYDVPDGKIRYDGININKIKKADLRRSLAMVLQDTQLFTGTVADNIRYGRLDATDEEVVAAAKLANADSFIRRLPQGYDTMLTTNGANLSQGQRQLLSIARAAVANAPVLILDEATSSIDTRTESLIERGMDTLMQGRTVFVIAHRLSTVRNADAIMVLEHGRIIERGSHDDLIAQHGKYYQLYTGAFELE